MTPTAPSLAAGYSVSGASETILRLGKAAVEQCLVCHGTAGNALNSTVPGIKAVHRWW